MRKPAICIYENKDADQLRSNWFVWDLVGNPEDQFSHNEAHFNVLTTAQAVHNTT